MEGSRVERLLPVASRNQHERHRRHYSEAPRLRPMGQGLELLALRRDGTTIPVEISLSPGTMASREQHVICAVRDITGWKRMRQLSRMMVTAAENERKSLSRELHDELLQSLVVLKMRVKLLADEPEEEARARARVRIASEIHDTIRGIKRMIRGLLPPVLDQKRLSAALRAVFRDIREVYGLTVHASLDQVGSQLDSFNLLALYRIIQEAVTNAARHAQVNEATVTLRKQGDTVIAEIRDEGCGFEVDGDIGLKSMRERAAMVGGRLTVDSSSGKGTTVRATVPLMGPENEQW